MTDYYYQVFFFHFVLRGILAKFIETFVFCCSRLKVFQLFSCKLYAKYCNIMLIQPVEKTLLKYKLNNNRGPGPRRKLKAEWKFFWCRISGAFQTFRCVIYIFFLSLFRSYSLSMPLSHPCPSFSRCGSVSLFFLSLPVCLYLFLFFCPSVSVFCFVTLCISLYVCLSVSTSPPV